MPFFATYFVMALLENTLPGRVWHWLSPLLTGSKSAAMKKKGKGLFLPCPEGVAVIWVLEIIYFYFI